MGLGRDACWTSAGSSEPGRRKKKAAAVPDQSGTSLHACNQLLCLLGPSQGPAVLGPNVMACRNGLQVGFNANLIKNGPSDKKNGPQAQNK